MTDWQISIPHRARADRIDLSDFADMTRQALGREDAQVARSVALEMVTDGGAQTYGALLDRLEAAGVAGRRQILDKARESAGLLSTERAEQRAEYERANAAVLPSGPMRDPQGRIQALCAAEGCSAFKGGEMAGMVAWVVGSKWWCSAHEHLAQPGDSEPHRTRLAYSSSGALRNLDEDAAEAERVRTQTETRRRRYEARQAERAAEAAWHEAVVQARREQLQRELPEGVRAP